MILSLLYFLVILYLLFLTFYPDFLTLLFQFPGCFVLVFYHDSLFTFFFGGDFVLIVF
jgi:hypothetical protein